MLRVGTTEGRFRMIMPDLMLAFEAAQAGNGGEGKQIRGLEATNPVFLLQRKDRRPDPAADLFIRLLEEKCGEIAAIQDSI